MSKSSKNRERRETVEQMRRQARAAERRRTLAVVAVCAIVALAIVGAAVFSYLSNQREQEELAGRKLAEIGVSASAANCSDISEVKATGQGDHTTAPVTYDVVPPSFGPHNPTAAEGGIHFYSEDDRPPVEVLVHNLEHGWTVVWYDETAAEDDATMKAMRAAADKFDAEGDDPRFNVIFAPWTSKDGNGKPIPEGKHVALTHWSIHQPKYTPPTSDETPESFGVSRYCETFSGDVLDEFMTDYPYDDAPEGFLWH